MVKQLNKHLSYEYSKSTSKLSALTYRDFLIFRKKFCGVFIFRGRRTFSMKTYSYILFKLKKTLKIKAIPLTLFFIIMKKLCPFLTIGQKRIGNNIINVPALLFGNKKNVLLMNWVVRQFRDKSNIYGINRDDALKSLIDTFYNRGSPLKMKAQHNENVILTRINLRNEMANYGDGLSSKKSKINYKDHLQLREKLKKGDEWDQLIFKSAREEFLLKEVKRFNKHFNKKQVFEEYKKWKEVEKDFDYLKALNNSTKHVAKDNSFIKEYKKRFIR